MSMEAERMPSHKSSSSSRHRRKSSRSSSGSSGGSNESLLPATTYQPHQSTVYWDGQRYYSYPSSPPVAYPSGYSSSQYSTTSDGRPIVSTAPYRASQYSTVSGISTTSREIPIGYAPRQYQPQAFSQTVQRSLYAPVQPFPVRQATAPPTYAALRQHAYNDMQAVNAIAQHRQDARDALEGPGYRRDPNERSVLERTAANVYSLPQEQRDLIYAAASSSGLRRNLNVLEGETEADRAIRAERERVRRRFHGGGRR